MTNTKNAPQTMELVDRLRAQSIKYANTIGDEAADEIERLQHDLTRYMDIASEEATKNEQLLAVLSELAGRIAMARAGLEQRPSDSAK